MIEPTDETDLAEVIAAATEPFALQGGGTRGAPGAGQALSTAALTGIVTYEPGALTLVARAGTPVAEIEASLAAEGQRLAFEPMDHRALLSRSGTPTIGGVFAANVSGPRRVAVGAARDFALGVRFVDGMGRVIKNGGRVMKNVTGYDLVKLLCGSRGQLGVITEIALKVLPTPETHASLRIPAPDPAQAIDILSRALGTPFEVTGAAWDGQDALLRVEGFETSVNYRLGKLKELLGGESDAVDWTALRDLHDFADKPGAVWCISVKPSEAPQIVARLPAGAACRFDCGGGVIWVLCPDETELRAALGTFSGHATRIRGQGAEPAMPPQPAEIERLEAGIKARFDPRALFAPAP